MQEWRATLHVQIRQLMIELANASVEEFDRVDTALRQVLPLYCARSINPQIRLAPVEHKRIHSACNY